MLIKVKLYVCSMERELIATFFLEKFRRGPFHVDLGQICSTHEKQFHDSSINLSAYFAGLNLSSTQGRNFPTNLILIGLLQWVRSVIERVKMTTFRVRVFRNQRDCFPASIQLDILNGTHWNANKTSHFLIFTNSRILHQSHSVKREFFFGYIAQRVHWLEA